MLMSAKQAIIDKFQRSVAAAYLRCGGVGNNQIKKGSLLNELKNLKLVNIWQSYKQEDDCFVHFLRLLAALAKRTSARDNHVLACNFARYSPILICCYKLVKN